MGKSKSSSKGKAAAVAKCTCDHPFKCDCGNRPERPSKGHKWDPETQAWGGKGHKQKGASGQTASIGQAEKVTSVGQTVIKQWQKLPTKLLADLLQKNGKTLGKGLPIYRPANNKSGGKGYRYRLVIPDTSKKGATNRSDHDIVLLPALSVPNEEQAKEEAALLGLLYLFPKLPHERTLPDPYRETYLAALENSKASAATAENNGNSNATKNAASSNNTNASKSSGGATSNTKLMANIPSFNKKIDSISSGGAPVILTKAQLDEARKEHKRAVQARIRKHEAIRNANKPMEVFMSAAFRRRIECLLSDTVFEEMNDADDVDNNDEDDDSEDVVKSYILQRLVFEGFMLSHVRKAYREVKKKGELSSIADNSDTNMDKAYEAVLQYLLVNLKEDQLPLGFDPRGGTLDVVGNGSLGKKKQTTKDKDTKNYDANILQLAKLFGLRPKESQAIFAVQKPESTARSTFWKVLCDAAPIPPERRGCDKFMDVLTDEDKERNMEAATNECEALEAIFEAEEFSIEKDNNNTSVFISIPYGDTKLSLEIHYKDGLYPDLLPQVFLASKDPNVDYHQGGTLHLKIVRFLCELSPGQECIFELFGHVQTLLQEADEGDPSLLLSKLNLDDEAESNAPIKSTNNAPKESGSGKQRSRQLQKLFRRPREKSSFFNTPPSKMTPAEAHPKLPVLMDRARKSLPAFKIRDEILSLMKLASESGRVSLVTGETGSGKSTQIPQYLLENDPTGSKIIVAQPRRLAATGVATRVALERNEEVGSGSVGYIVRGDSKTCDKTRLLFLTTGVLLRQLQSQNALDNISHIVIDEVHERHLDTDVLLAILKEMLSSYPKLHVVLMSATMDSDRMAAYWSSKEVTNTPRIHIPGRTFPVKDFMLEDVLQMTGYIPPKNGKKKAQFSRGGKYQIQSSLVDDEFDEEGGDVAEKSIESRPEECTVPLEERLKRMNEQEIDYDLIALLIKNLLRTKDDDGSILVFLPGAGEIDRASNAILTILRGSAISILPLHGGLQPEKQQQVFIPAKKGYTKIVLSTNVAETSITIPDCTIVIDTCKEKQSSFDPVNRMPLLLETFASRDSLKQRRGRAGRVRPGNCYKLVSSSFYGKLPEHGEPEIRRCSLDQTILSLLFLGLEDGTGKFLRLLLDPPSGEAVKSAFYSLEQIGALARNGDVANLTPLGVHLAGIPAPPTVGKLLVMGSLLGCRNMSIAIASGMSVGRSPFLRINTPHRRHGKQLNGDVDQENDERNDNILRERANIFEAVGNSDHAMLGKIFELWQSCSGAAERRRFCDRFGLAFNSMREMAQLAKQLDSSLTTSGFAASQDSNKNENSWRVVRSVIVSALSPTQIVRVQRPTTKYTETVEGAVAKDGVSQELKFFIREGNDVDTNVDGKGEDGKRDKRVFIHPSSNNFSVGTYSCPWLVYHRLVQTSKAFISDSTECNAYAMLMFGGTMDVQASKGLIVLDNYVQLSANPRIGSLIGRLRERVDDLLEKKVADPSLDITNSTEMAIITDLLKRDGC